MHGYTIETDRLLLRALCPADAKSVYLWASDPEVSRYVRFTTYQCVEDGLEWLTRITDDPHEFGVVRRSDGQLIGSCNVIPVAEGASTWEIGYVLRRDCWGQGYATELARALLRYARETYGIHDFIGIHAVENQASGHVLEKCGFVFSEYGKAEKFEGSVQYDIKCCALHLD